MKKFQFSLEKLLSFKQQIFDVERGILAEMNAHLQQLIDRKNQLRQELHRGSQELNQKYAQGITALEIAQHKIYLDAVGESIRQKEQEIVLQRQAISRQMDKVREAKIEISTLEKLREKKLEEYNYLANKSEEQFIEEFVSNQKAVALQA